MKPSHGHNERLLHRERETLASVFNERAWLFLADNELTSTPSPLNNEPLKSQYYCGEIGNSERTEVSTDSWSKVDIVVKQQSQRFKYLLALSCSTCSQNEYGRQRINAYAELYLYYIRLF